MAREVAKASSGALASVQALKAHLRLKAASLPSNGAKGFLTFSKGDWSYGAEQQEVTPEDLMAVNPASFIDGQICWPKDEALRRNGPIDTIELALGEPAPATLPDHEDGVWQKLAGFRVKFTEGPFKGEEAKFAGSSHGCLQAVRALMDAVLTQLDDDPLHPVPVVAPRTRAYDHKKWGKVKFPEFDIVDWIGMDGVADDPDEPEADAEDAVAEEPEAEPEAELEAEPVAEDEAPARRRRRRRA